MSQLPKRRREAARTAARERAGQQVAIIHRDLVGAVLIRAAIKEGHVESALDNHLVAQLVGKAEPGSEVLPMNIGTVESGASGAAAKLRRSPGNATCRRIRAGVVRIEEHDQCCCFQ